MVPGQEYKLGEGDALLTWSKVWCCCGDVALLHSVILIGLRNDHPLNLLLLHERLVDLIDDTSTRDIPGRYRVITLLSLQILDAISPCVLQGIAQPLPHLPSQRPLHPP